MLWLKSIKRLNQKPMNVARKLIVMNQKVDGDEPEADENDEDIDIRESTIYYFLFYTSF